MFERGLRPSGEHVRRLAEVVGVPAETLLRRPRVVRQHDALQAVVIEDAAARKITRPDGTETAGDRGGDGGAA
jgi:hypothetical protein